MRNTLLAATLMSTLAFAEEASIASIPFKDIDGKETSLAAYSGKVILAVNVASRCGHTSQYTGLQALHTKYSPQGLVILAFPCNDFGRQEPGTNAEIKEFCSKEYAVTFPIMNKISVKGPEQHPLYKALTGPGSAFPGDVQWNFGKFLISREGKPLARFEPGVQPQAPALVQAIETALAAK